MLRIALDTETTGVDLYHSCRPFIVTICRSDAPEEPLYWPWKVDPLTRKVQVVAGDRAEIWTHLEEADELVFQNAKFDIRALISVGLKWKKAWWPKVHDLLYSGHILASGQLHNLTDMLLMYLGVDILPLEERLGEICKEARTIARKEYPAWKIAKEGEEGLPSLKGSSSKKKKDGTEVGKTWKWDMWLPGAIAELKGYPANHPFRTVVEEYFLADSCGTLALRAEHQRLIEERGLTKLYEKRRRLIKVLAGVESNGVTYSNSRKTERYTEFKEESETLNKTCVFIAADLGFELALPKSGTNKSLLAFAKAKEGLDFETKLKESLLDPSKDFGAKRSKDVLKGIYTDSGEISLNKENRAAYRVLVPDNSPQAKFVDGWSKRQSYNTAIQFMDSYERFACPTVHEDIRRLHPSLNATATNTIRMSSERPNEQNISKKSEANLRYLFGPGPGREWWSMDYENLELRIPAYEANEYEMIQLFERPNDPPYYGSQHLLIAHILWTTEFDKCLAADKSFKKVYKDTLYQWTKNGDFAVTYGAIEESGTADAAYHQPGAQRKIKSRFKNLAKLNDVTVDLARRQGFVETLIDREVGVGYPLQIPRNKWGDIRPTTPLNYRVQGTAMWCTCKAMDRCEEYLEPLPGHYFMTMQVHDEIVFDFPRGARPDSNLPIALECRRLMELSGEDIGIPLKVDVSYHPNNWSESVDLKKLETLAA